METGQDDGTGGHLRLVWPQWQGAGSDSVRALAPEFPFDTARRGYAVGTAVLQAILPPHDGPTAVVPVRFDDIGLEERDGIEAKTVVLDQLRAALAILDQYAPDRVSTLGGECSVSMAPFSHLLARYGDDLAILWVDSHPDVDTGETDYAGYHAMVVSALTGHGDDELLRTLPATTTGARVALVGVHDWTNPAHEETVAGWGISAFGPDQVRERTTPVLEWLAATGASKVAIHVDVDTVDADEIRLGLGADLGGLTGAQVSRVVADVAAVSDVVALTIAEYIPRQAMHLRRIVGDFPLIAGPGGVGADLP